MDTLLTSAVKEAPHLIASGIELWLGALKVERGGSQGQQQLCSLQQRGKQGFLRNGTLLRR